MPCAKPAPPAHAGMDPVHPSAPPGEGRLPRTRGDGPCSRSGMTTTRTAPPHTRGWTLRQRLVAEDVGGSPAHAGMDPPPSPGADPAARLPRTRGDGPTPNHGSPARASAPPHTRGWTRVTGGSVAVERGSPAHAGMDPPPVVSLLDRHTAPPHTRGWTLVARRHRGLRTGSPAHAGMDPLSAASRTSPIRLPRTRGDGPWPEPRTDQPDEAPPHTRGWTPELVQ